MRSIAILLLFGALPIALGVWYSWMTGWRSGGGPPANLVSESGLYKLIMVSTKPTSAPFKDWVTAEVLPAIRKTGGYMLKGADRQAIQEGTTATIPLPGDIRVVPVDGRPWFVAADACRVLEMDTSRGVYQHLRNIPEGERKTQKLNLGIRGNPNVTLLSKKGLVRLIMRSDKPIAAPFQDWAIDVVVEVLETGKREERPGEEIPMPGDYNAALRPHRRRLPVRDLQGSHRDHRR